MLEECLARKQRDRGPQAGHSATDTSAPSGLPLRFPSSEQAGFGPVADFPFWPGNNYNAYVDDNFAAAVHNGFFISEGVGTSSFPRSQANVGVTHFARAHHELKLGLDFQQTEWTGEYYRTSWLQGYEFDSLNPFGFRGAGGLGDDTCSLTRSPATSALNPSPFGLSTRGRICVWVDFNAEALQDLRGSRDAEMRDTAVYFRDRFSLGDHWSFNLGLRAEIQQGFNDIRRKVVDDAYADPRASVTYDVRADGTLLLNLSVGRYHTMLNQVWIDGSSEGGMHDLWNGYEGFETWLFCDPLEAQAFCPDQQGEPKSGYNFLFTRVLPGRMWEAVDAGIFEHDLDVYYKKEVIFGLEWQLSQTWALDVKYIDWELEDMDVLEHPARPSRPPDLPHRQHQESCIDRRQVGAGAIPTTATNAGRIHPQRLDRVRLPDLRNAFAWRAANRGAERHRSATSARPRWTRRGLSGAEILPAPAAGASIVRSPLLDERIS